MASGPEISIRLALAPAVSGGRGTEAKPTPRICTALHCNPAGFVFKGWIFGWHAVSGHVIMMKLTIAWTFEAQRAELDYVEFDELMARLRIENWVRMV